MQAALRSQYGPLSARGLALRSGRESFKYGLREYGQQAGLLDTKYRLLPTQAKLKTGFYWLARLIEETGSFQAQILEDERHTSGRWSRAARSVGMNPMAW